MEPMPGHNRRKGKSGRRASAFKYRPRDWHLAKWMRADAASFRLARLIKLSLGRLPARLAAFGRADFDLDEDREYGDGPQQAVSGGELAGIAAHIIRSARQGSQDYFLSLKGLPAAIIEPLKIYLRVKLAVGRLDAEIANAQAAETNETPPPKPMAQKRSARPQPPPKAYTWHTSPAKIYNFKEMAKTCGYDPRETSAYWIEKRANALRRKWKTYHQIAQGEGPKAPKPKQVTAPNPEPVLRHFTPADADYNSVWPPVKLPDGRPKTSPARAPIPVIPEFSQENIRDLGSDCDAEDYMRFDGADEQRPLYASRPAKAVPACEVPDICAANSGMTDGGEAHVVGETVQKPDVSAVMPSTTSHETSPAIPSTPTSVQSSDHSSQPRQAFAPAQTTVIPEFSEENIRDLGSACDADDYMRFDGADEQRPLYASRPAKAVPACEVPDICAANSGMTDLGEARAIASHPVNFGVTGEGKSQTLSPHKRSTKRKHSK